jgi:hypothetical protein
MTGTSATPCTARGNGYLGSIAVNAVLLYSVTHVLEWQVGWITPAWADVVWPLSLSLEVSIAANALFLVYDNDWFRYPLLAASSLVAFQAVYALYAVFPFDFGNAWNVIVRLVLLALILAIGIGTIVTTILGVLHLARAAAHERGFNV